MTLTATLADGDIRGLRTPDWQWQVETGSGTGVFEDIDEAVNAAYTPRAASDDYDGDADKKLKVVAQYEDSHGTDYAEVTLESEFAVRTAPTSNVAPMFRDTDDVPGTGADEVGVQTSRRIEENSPPGMYVGPPVFATDNNHLAADDANDPGGPRDVLTYSLAAASDTADDGLFSIDQITGQIMTKSPLNMEGLSNITDQDRDTADGLQLQVTAIATDPSGATGTAIVTIHVLDVDEAPQVRGPAALTYFENQPTATSLTLFRDPTQSDTDAPGPAVSADTNQATYMATDNDLTLTGLTLAGSDIQWQITGDDASKFQFVGSTGTYTDSPQPPATTGVAASPVLQFSSAPDLENAADVGGTPGDNVYEITVVAWDGDWEIGSRDVTIRVADSNDEGTVTLSHVQAQVGTPITATLNDQDDISTSVDWAWTVNDAAAAAGTVKSSGNTSTYTPPAGTTGELGITAMYTDGGGNTETVSFSATPAVTVQENPVTPATETDEGGLNTPPKFYMDGVAVADVTNDAANRIPENETDTYTRYILENQHPRNVRNTDTDARTYPDTSLADDNTAASLKFFDGYFPTFASRPSTTDPDGTVMSDIDDLHFGLSGADAKYFAIGNTDTDRGLIRTKGPLNFETKSTYTVTVTATDPAGLTDTARVTIEVLDVPEIQGLAQRIRVDENTKEIANLHNSYATKTGLGGLKWFLLTEDPANVDCLADPSNTDADGTPFCDDFRFSRNNTSDTTLLFAIGTGEKHDAPNFEKPADEEDETVTPTVAAGDNVYKIVARVSFANLRSYPAVDPQDDEKNDRVVWIRVDDVDEDPKFTDDDSTRLISENTDDLLPAIAINRLVVGTVKASDPEYEYMAGPQFGKKLNYSVSFPEAYRNLFQIVPSNGDILTRARLN